jgi:hypothetical protein
MAEMLEFDMKLLDRELRRLDKNLDRTSRRGEAALTQAMMEYGEDTLAEATQRAPHDEGALRASGLVDGPHNTTEGKEVIIAFNKEYAAIQDVGGIVRAKRAKALFIPLRKGATPGDPSLIMGEDFWLQPSVEIKGNKYLTGIIEDRTRKMAPALAKRMFGLMRRAG